MAAWQLIKEVALMSAKGYPQTLEEDEEIIAKDNEQQYLTLNQRNCVLFRMGEKEIYRFLAECAECMQAVMSTGSVKEAK